MPFFSAYVMVDWSGGDGRRSTKKDCIWIAHGRRTSTAPTTTSPPSRTEAEASIRELVRPFAGSRDDRVLVCADFAYGYPAGFASLLPGMEAKSMPAWWRVWRHLRAHVLDDVGGTPGRRPTNRSNRFAVASAINATSSPGGVPGPFWCLFSPGSHPHVPQNQPAQPFRHGSVSIDPLRITDTRAQSDTPFRLFGAGSVGSQVLTGIPRLESLRFGPDLAAHSVVWPFETGWACAQSTWLTDEQRIVHAEIYPSVRQPLQDTVKDRGQVRAMWHWARDLDLKDDLLSEFRIPRGVQAGSADDVRIRHEEGWILGCPS